MKLKNICRNAWTRHWDRKLDHRRNGYAAERAKMREVIQIAKKMIEAKGDHQDEANAKSRT